MGFSPGAAKTTAPVAIDEGGGLERATRSRGQYLEALGPFVLASIVTAQANPHENVRKSVDHRFSWMRPLTWRRTAPPWRRSSRAWGFRWRKQLGESWQPLRRLFHDRTVRREAGLAVGLLLRPWLDWIPPTCARRGSIFMSPKRPLVGHVHARLLAAQRGRRRPVHVHVGHRPRQIPAPPPPQLGPGRVDALHQLDHAGLGEAPREVARRRRTRGTAGAAAEAPGAGRSPAPAPASPPGAAPRRCRRSSSRLSATRSRSGARPPRTPASAGSPAASPSRAAPSPSASAGHCSFGSGRAIFSLPERPPGWDRASAPESSIDNQDRPFRYFF